MFKLNPKTYHICKPFFVSKLNRLIQTKQTTPHLYRQQTKSCFLTLRAKLSTLELCAVVYSSKTIFTT